MMKIVMYSVISFFLFLLVTTTLLYYVLKHLHKNQNVVNSARINCIVFPTFSIEQSKQCSEDMEKERTQNHQFDKDTPYAEQIKTGMTLLNNYKTSENTSLSAQYKEGQNG